MAFEPRIERLAENDGTLTISFSNTNYSFVNALRRTILTDIPVVCFKTFPYNESNCDIIKNTSQLNNEIIKHRLSCIPIHLNPDEDYYKNIKVIIRIFLYSIFNFFSYIIRFYTIVIRIKVIDLFMKTKIA